MIAPLASARRSWRFCRCAVHASALWSPGFTGAVLVALALVTASAVHAAPAHSAPGYKRPESLRSILTAEAPPADALTTRRSERDLGNRVCAPYAAYCVNLWRKGVAAGVPFNRLISEVCLHVRVLEHEDAGIACAETAIRLVPQLPDSVLVRRQFAPGERARNVLWHDRTDRQWAATVARYFQRIPSYCDHATPIIHNYFPCLLREVHFFQVVLKRYRLE